MSNIRRVRLVSKPRPEPPFSGRVMGEPSGYGCDSTTVPFDGSIAVAAARLAGAMVYIMPLSIFTLLKAGISDPGLKIRLGFVPEAANPAADVWTAADSETVTPWISRTPVATGSTV